MISHRRVLAACAALACFAVIAAEALAVPRRYLVNDDYQLLYTAWMESVGKLPGRDFFVASYHVLTELLTPLFRLFPETLAPLFLARTALVAVLALSAVILWRLGARCFSPGAAALAPALALCTTPILERSLDVRPDLLTTALWLAALAVLARPGEARPRDRVLLGLLLGLSVVNRFKAGLILPLVALALLADALAEPRPVRRLLRDAGLVALPLLACAGLYGAWLWHTGALAWFGRANAQLFSEMAKLGDTSMVSRAQTLVTALEHDPLLWGLAAMGALARALRFRHFPQRANRIAGCLAALAVLSVALNPAYYPYNLVTLVPLLAPFAAEAAALLIEAAAAAGRRWLAPALAAAFALVPLASHWGELSRLAGDATIAHQERLLRFVLAETAPDDGVFALEGIGLFRPSVFHWRLPAVLLGSYRAGAFDLARELAAAPPTLVVLSYRVPGWLEPAAQAFLGHNYVELAPRLLTLGHAWHAGDAEAFELLRSGRYQATASQGGSCTLDGAALRPQAVVALAAGPHRLGGTIGCTLRRAFSPKALEPIQNPQLPYLLAPELRLPRPGDA